MGRSDDKPARLTTVLGTVVSLGKGVLEHREYVKETWERLQESGDDGMGPVDGAVAPQEFKGGKRKRSSELELDVEFVEGGSEDSEYDEVELMLKSGGKKVKRAKSRG
jgi:hypothetical protein